MKIRSGYVSNSSSSSFLVIGHIEVIKEENHCADSINTQKKLDLKSDEKDKINDCSSSIIENLEKRYIKRY